ncbi:hypothetical protein Franean1_2077 [Parafrankia sp. EAN1pec]|nr:hypothetical protein Franean1_2077 [Frankia sp. EAN1pec]
MTGGSGFVGAHTIAALLAQGHQVRTTIRSWSRVDDVQEMATRGGAEPDERLSFAVADLTRDDGWAEAVAGCEVVLHVASPFPGGPPEHEDEDELIVPARDGAGAARRVGLRAARRRNAGTCGDQPGRDLRAGAGRGLLQLHRARTTPTRHRSPAA